MPIYEVKCSECGHITEYYARISTNKLSECPQCGGSITQLFSPPQLQLRTRSGQSTYSFEQRNKFTQPYKQADARKRDYFFGGN